MITGNDVIHGHQDKQGNGPKSSREKRSNTMSFTRR